MFIEVETGASEVLKQPDSPTELLQGSSSNSPIVFVNPTIANVLRETFKFKTGNTQLNERTIVVLDSSEREPASPQGRELSELINEFNEKKHEVGGFTWFFIRLKTFFSGDYDTEIAKQSFRQIQNKQSFLKAAWAYIALPENAANRGENIKNLLKFVEFNEIVDLLKNNSIDVDDKIKNFEFLLENISSEEINASKGSLRLFLAHVVDEVALADDKQGTDLIPRLNSLQKLCDGCKEKEILLENCRNASSRNDMLIEQAADKKLAEMLTTYITASNPQPKYQEALKTIALLRYPFCHSSALGIEDTPIGIQICQVIDFDNKNPANCLSNRFMRYFNCQENPDQLREKIMGIREILSTLHGDFRQGQANFVQLLKDNSEIKGAFQQMTDDFPVNGDFSPFETFAYIFGYYVSCDNGPFYNFVHESLEEANRN
ncbi:MAG: hypothetical protein LBC30_02295 [Puniceicoccales bacterium]|nr:hypothetical protein [Puniceicoccales bacterium]